MFSYQNNIIALIPLSYNVFLSEFDNDVIPSFASTINLSKEFIDDLVAYIASIKNKIIYIDFKYVSSYTSRAFASFLELKNIENVIFYNVTPDTFLANGIIEELNSILKNEIIKDDNGKPITVASGIYYFSKDSLKHIDNLSSIAIDIPSSFMKETIETVLDIETTFLESSGIYSNMYVALKRLFSNHERTAYVVYKMSELFVNEFSDVDAIISTSKTGAVFACLISKIVGKKAVHCAGVGPKYSLSTDLLKKEVRPQKKYAYVSDFICLGTEVKILNALVNNSNAKLSGGVCVASFIDLNNEDLKGVLSKSYSLINIVKQGIDYRVSPEKHFLKKEKADCAD